MRKSFIPTLKDINLRLLQSLQHLHDSMSFWDLESSNPNHAFSIAGLAEIKRIAKNYKLEIPEIFKTTKEARNE